MNKENIIAALICCMVVSMMLIGLDGYNLSEERPKERKTIVEYYEPPEDIVLDTTAEEATEEETTRETFYDVPLDEELQRFIISEAEANCFNPSLIFAIIEVESGYEAGAIGDSGNSLGLMQIQPMWNEERMQRLGVTDLMDPYQNVRVGINILAEYAAKYEDITFVLMCYNGGESYAHNKINQGIYSTEYTEYVLQRSLEINCDVARNIESIKSEKVG